MENVRLSFIIYCNFEITGLKLVAGEIVEKVFTLPSPLCLSKRTPSIPSLVKSFTCLLLFLRNTLTTFDIKICSTEVLNCCFLKKEK